MRWLAALAALLALSACDESVGESGTLRVSAAASLGPAMEEMVEAYGAARPGVEVTLNLASTGTLRRQIEAADAADLLCSANQAHMQALVERGLIEEIAVFDLCRNSLVLACPGGSDISEIGGLRVPIFERIAIGSPATAPVGTYAREALESAGLWDEIEPRLVFAESATQLVAYLERGEVDAAIIYRTDLARLDTDALTVIEIDSALHSPVVYTVATVGPDPIRAPGWNFVEFCTGPQGNEIMERHGFTPLLHQ